MIAALRRPEAASRIALLCFGFTPARRGKQPWNTVDALARALASEGHRVHLFTDGAPAHRSAAYETHRLPVLLCRGRLAPDLRREIEDLAPARLYLLGGLTELARLRPLDAPCPVSYLLASPRPRPGEVLTVPPAAWRWERRALVAALAGALLPAAWLARRCARAGIDEIIYFSPETRFRLWYAGLPWGPLLLPASTLALLPARASGPLVITYYGPPLYLRGADLVLRSFEEAVSRGFAGRLQLLLRPDDPETLAAFLRRVERSPARARIEVVARTLEPAALQGRLAATSVFLLPFRLPVSEAPLVLFEAAATGRPVVVLDRPGIGALARALGLTVVAREAQLADALRKALRAPAGCRPPTAARRWSAARMLPPCPEPPRWVWVGLCGLDGVGKTTLLERLEEELRAAGFESRRRWSRYRNYLSKPLLALLRLTGHSRLERHAGIPVRVRDLRHPLRGWPFLILQALDQLIEMRFRYRARGRILLLDRCLFDTLVDLAVETGRERFVLERLAPLLYRFAPRPHLAVLIERGEPEVRASRPDAADDPDRLRRRRLYRELAQRFALPVVANDGTLETALHRITSLLGLADDLRVLQQ